MSKFSLYALAPLAALLAGTAAHAQNCAGHCAQSQCGQYGCGPTAMQKTHDSYWQNSIWPKQYMAPSRRGICQAFELTIANGWRRNNLLGRYDFTPDGESLSDAGRLRVEWILTNAPPQRRTIFVQRGADPAQTASRVDAVQTLAANMNPSYGPADIQETSMHDEGRPAASVDAVFTGFGANQPPPVLPTANNGTSSEGS